MASTDEDDVVPTRDPFTPTRPAYLPQETTADPQDSEQPIMPFPPALQQQALAGHTLLKAMIRPYAQMSTAMHDAQSTFRYAADAQEQGWRLSGVGHDAVDHTTEWEEPYVIQYGISVLGLGLETALDAVQVDDRHMYWTKLTYTHSRDGVANGRTYKATGAKVTNYYNPTLSTIITGNLEDNLDMRQTVLGSTTPNSNLPPLRAWHDLTYLAFHETNPNDIEHIFYYNVEDQDKLTVLKQLVLAHDLTDRARPWGGTAIRLWKDGQPVSGHQAHAAAVLAVFKEISLLLTTHKAPETFGDRFIDEIHIFTCPKINADGSAQSGDGLWCVYFHVQDLEELGYQFYKGLRWNEVTGEWVSNVAGIWAL